MTAFFREHFDTPTLLLLAALFLLAVAVLWRLTTRPRFRGDMPFSRHSALLTPGELRFYRLLLGAVPSGLTVFVKVRLMDVVEEPGDAWRQYGAPGSGMHLDFVLTDAASTEPRLVVELDDRSHWQAEARKRDAFKDAALASAGVPLLRVPAAARYDQALLKQRIACELASRPLR